MTIRKERLKSLFIICILGCMAFGFCMSSPINPISRKAPGTDSSVFLTIGLGINNGLVPYSELFDHKGPLIYLINSVGLKIWGMQGVWLLEAVSIWLTIYSIYKTVRRFSSSFAGLLVSFCLLAALVPIYEGGNLTEVYALPFSCCALYIFSGYFLNEYKLNFLHVFFIGLTFGGVLLIRANLIGVWIGMCLVIFIHTLFKNPQKCLLYIGGFLTGLVAIILPFIIWFSLKGALNDLWESYIQFNIDYSESNLADKLIVAFKGLLRYIFVSFSALFYLFVFLRYKNSPKNHRLLFLAGATSLAVGILLATMSGRFYPHYFISLIPMAVIPLMFCTAYMEKRAFKGKMNAKALIVLILAVGIAYPTPYHGYPIPGAALFSIQTIQTILFEDRELLEITNLIKQKTKMTDKISVVGNNCIMYVLSDRMSASKYIYQAGICEIDREIVDNYIKDLNQNPPKLIVINKSQVETKKDFDDLFINVNTFLSEEKYEMVYSSSHYLIFES
jgi:hypothetical protein